MFYIYKTVLDCSILCRSIYTYKRPPNIKNKCIINQHKPHCILYTLQNNNNIYIVIRGTEISDVNNLYTNFDYQLINTPEFNCKIHKGYYTYFLNIKDVLKSHINKLKNQKKR